MGGGKRGQEAWPHHLGGERSHGWIGSDPVLVTQNCTCDTGAGSEEQDGRALVAERTLLLL